jgi:hypothetical protein
MSSVDLLDTSSDNFTARAMIEHRINMVIKTDHGNGCAKYIEYKKTTGDVHKDGENINDKLNDAYDETIPGARRVGRRLKGQTVTVGMAVSSMASLSPTALRLLTLASQFRSPPRKS